eukprot:scaffold667191_cov64-Prasinocladus_malaysianus.AAC.1
MFYFNAVSFAALLRIEAVKAYIGSFFQCADCAKHFTQRIEQSDADEVATRRDAVLWIWRVHNEVGAKTLNYA